jgi:hypothetical protein
MERGKKSLFGCGALVIALVAGQGCAAAVYQDARTIGKGRVELMPTITAETIGTAVGGIVTAGISDTVDLSAGFASFSGGGPTFAGFGPKVSLSKDRAAFVLPVIVSLNDDGEGWTQLTPTFVFSTPMGDKATFNTGLKAIVSDCDGCSLRGGAHVGFSLPIGNRVTLRPELDALLPGLTWSIGFGVSVRGR